MVVLNLTNVTAAAAAGATELLYNRTGKSKCILKVTGALDLQSVARRIMSSGRSSQAVYRPQTHFTSTRHHTHRWRSVNPDNPVNTMQTPTRKSRANITPVCFSHSPAVPPNECLISARVNSRWHISCTEQLCAKRTAAVPTFTPLIRSTDWYCSFRTAGCEANACWTQSGHGRMFKSNYSHYQNICFAKPRLSDQFKDKDSSLNLLFPVFQMRKKKKRNVDLFNHTVAVRPNQPLCQEVKSTQLPQHSPGRAPGEQGVKS